MSPPRSPACVSCGCAISDDGPEQTDAWLESMCPACFEASEHSLSDRDAVAGFGSEFEGAAQ